VSAERCRCGHDREAHYEYVLNGRAQGRCRDCDPTKHRTPGNYVMVADSYEAAMDRTADHDFAPDPADA
jgi:hypothetical protein